MPPADSSADATAAAVWWAAATAAAVWWAAATAAGAQVPGRAGEPGPGAGDVRIAVLCDDLPAVSGLAVTAEGGLLACLDGATGSILVLDPRDPEGPEDPERPRPPAGRRIAVSGRDGPRPLAIAFIDSRTLAAVCREGDDWSLHTWRFETDRAADPAAALQAIPLGRAAGQADGVVLAVGQGYRWLVVSGLPPPLEPLQLAAMVGGRIGPLSSRRCPRLTAGARPVAATVGPRDELVLAERPVPPVEGDVISFHAMTGGCLLRLDAELTGIRSLASSPGDGGLWAVVGESATGDARPAGLWRLDAALEAGRQVIAPQLVLPLRDPRWLVSVPEPTSSESQADSGLVVIHDTAGGRRVIRIDRGAAAQAAVPHEGMSRDAKAGEELAPEGR